MAVAGPIVLSQLGSVGMHTMDTLMVGPLGATALAAAGLGSALHTVLMMMSMGMLMGMSPLVSQAFGAGQRPEARRVLVQGLWLSAILSIPLIVYNLVGEWLAIAFGQPYDVAVLTGGYMAALAAGVPPFLMFIALRQYLEGMGRTKPAMVITFIGLAVNFVGNSALIYGVPGLVEPMGVVGSGWATTLVRWVMLALMVGYVVWQPDLHPLQDAGAAPEWRRLRRIVVIGAPTGAQVGLEVGLFSFAAVMMGWFGTVELGSHQITINLAATTFMLAMGTSLAGSIRVGMHVGGRRPRAVRRAVVVTYIVSISAMGLCALLFIGLAIHALPPRAGETVARLLARLPSPATALAFGVTVLIVEAIRPEGIAPFIYFQL